MPGRQPLFTLQQQSLPRGNTTVLHDISLQIFAGEKIALIGPSGAGNSCLLAWLYPQQAQQIALCPQQGGLVDILSVFHTVFMGALARHAAGFTLLTLTRPFAQPKQDLLALCTDPGT